MVYFHGGNMSRVLEQDVQGWYTISWGSLKYEYIGLRNSCWAEISVFSMVIHDCIYIYIYIYITYIYVYIYKYMYGDIKYSDTRCIYTQKMSSSCVITHVLQHQFCISVYAYTWMRLQPKRTGWCLHIGRGDTREC